MSNNRGVHSRVFEPVFESDFATVLRNLGPRVFDRFENGIMFCAQTLLLVSSDFEFYPLLPSSFSSLFIALFPFTLHFASLFIMGRTAKKKSNSYPPASPASLLKAQLIVARADKANKVKKATQKANKENGVNIYTYYISTYNTHQNQSHSLYGHYYIITFV
jgi:hypothetical protein